TRRTTVGRVVSAAPSAPLHEPARASPCRRALPLPPRPAASTIVRHTDTAPDRHAVVAAARGRQGRRSTPTFTSLAGCAGASGAGDSQNGDGDQPRRHLRHAGPPLPG